MSSLLFGPVFIFLCFGSSACQSDEAAASSATAAGTGSTTKDEPPTTGAVPEPTTGATTGTTGDPTTGALPGTTSTTDATTGDGGPYCGDGHVDPGEACDAGPDNADDGACTVQCSVAVCGDGLVWAGVEACDFGDGNSNKYGGCDACQWGPRCGDAVVDAGDEECDLGDLLNGTGVAEKDQGACTATCN